MNNAARRLAANWITFGMVSRTHSRDGRLNRHAENADGVPVKRPKLRLYHDSSNQFKFRSR
jgi:hypothetical protein